MKTARVRCKGCNRYVADNWRSKLKHTVNRHPENLINQMSACVARPEIFQEMGARLAQMFNARLRQ